MGAVGRGLVYEFEMPSVGCFLVPPSEVVWARLGSCDPGAGVHGFVEDRRLEALARGSYAGIGVGRRWAVGPDFSILGDMPAPVVWYQAYRSRLWCQRIGVRFGIPVVPSVGWAGSAVDRYAFDGIRIGSCVAVRAPGADAGEVSAWASGYLRMLRVVCPRHVMVFGVYRRVEGVLLSSGVCWSSHSLRVARLRR